TFCMCPPKEYIRFETRLNTNPQDLGEPVDFSKAELSALLEKNGLYRELENMIEEVLAGGKKGCL
ncbi:MAG: hypothetical protein P8107_15295, partial [Spirochaetia bacterium]